MYMAAADEAPGFFESWRRLVAYRELVLTLTWRNIIVAYKQSYMGVGWAVLKPVLLMVIFTVVKSFIGIDSGEIPYPILTFAALIPWLVFQEATSSSINSVTSNAGLIRKIYFPREVFPMTVIAAKVVDLAISFAILAGLMAYYGMAPTWNVLWVPLLIVYTFLASLTIGLLGAAANVYYRDVSKAMPVIMQLLMYASPVIYPLALVDKALLVNEVAGAWSQIGHWLYLCNPMAGIIDGYQKSLLYGESPELAVLFPGMLVVGILLPISYRLFKRAERHFADVI